MFSGALWLPHGAFLQVWLESCGATGMLHQRGGMSRWPPLSVRPGLPDHGRHLTRGCVRPRSPHPVTGCGPERMVCSSHPMGTTLKTIPAPQLPAGSAEAIAGVSLQAGWPLRTNLIISFKEKFFKSQNQTLTVVSRRGIRKGREEAEHFLLRLQVNTGHRVPAGLRL